MTDEELLGEIEDLIRNRPPRDTIRHELEENWSWFGRVAALIGEWNQAKTIPFEFEKSKLLGRQRGGMVDGSEYNKIMMLLHEVRSDLRMKTIGPVSMAIGKGQVFDYFDEVRKIVESASADVFFVDPYLDADFVSRYLPHIGAGVTIRLLADKKLATLLPAVQSFTAQSGANVDVRSAKGFHDRYLFIDRSTCYQSGASFKDGANKSPTTVTQITDAFKAVYATYEDMWNKGAVT